MTDGRTSGEDLARRATSGVGWSVVNKGGARLLTLPVFVVLTQLLVPEDFGLVAVATAYVAFLLALQAGLPSAIVQRDRLVREHLDSAFWAAAAIGALVAAVTFLAAPIAAGAMDEPRLTSVLRAFAIVPLLTGFDAVPQGLFMRALDFRSLAVRSLAALVVGAVVGVWMAAAGFGVWALVAKAVVEQVARTAVLWLAVDHRPRFAFSRTHLDDLVTVGLSSLGSRLTDVAREHVDDLVIGAVLGARALGFYTVAYRILVVFDSVFVQTLSRVSLPTFSRVQDDEQRLRRAVRKALRLTAVVGLPAFVGLSVLADPLLPLAFGDTWAPSVPAMRWLAIAGAAQTVGLIAGPALVAVGRAPLSTAMHSAQFAAAVVAVLVAVSHGIGAVAAAYALAGLAMAVAWLAVLQRTIGVPLARGGRDVLPPLLAAAAMAAVTSTVLHLLGGSQAGWDGLIATIAAGALTYLAGLAIVGRAALVETVEAVRMVTGRGGGPRLDRGRHRGPSTAGAGDDA